jgi:3'-phosphoadenosine 5'-phosphosulfate sulfotransferase (PAPS reductase)/FAD synthetase
MEHEDAWKSFAITFSYLVLDTLLKYKKVLNFADQLTAALHRDRCAACRQAHTNFADESVCLMADNVSN